VTARRPRAPDRRRVARRLAAGLTARQTARLLRVAPAEVEALLVEPGFRELVEGHARLGALPREERLRRLESLALWLLEEAIDEGDAAAAAFVVRERRRGRDPARTLAQGVDALLARDRAVAGEALPPRSSPRRRPPADAVDRRAWATADRLRRRLTDEQIARARVVEAAAGGPGAGAARAGAPVRRDLRPDVESGPPRPEGAAWPRGP
jgi:hypothetical protein